MERSQSKCSYHPYDRHKSDSSPSSDCRHHHHHSSNSRPLPPPLPPSSSHARNNSHLDSNANSFSTSRAITFFKILCPNSRIGSIIGKSGSIIRSFRSKSGARINVHPLVLDDSERIIDISDDHRCKCDSLNSHCSPAQEALLMIHDHIIADKTDNKDRDEGERRKRGGKGRDWDRMTTRLVVPKAHIGCLMGKGGKIIEQMRVETRTHIRILPKNHYTPRCVATTEEIVQVLANADASLI